MVARRQVAGARISIDASGLERGVEIKPARLESRRTMNPVRIAILGVALVAAIGLAVLLRGFFAPKTTSASLAAAAAKPAARVLVAARDLPVGTRLAAADMKWQPWPADSLNPAFITDGGAVPPANGDAARVAKGLMSGAKDIVTGGGPKMQAMEGAVVHDAIFKGEPIVRGKIVIAGQGGYMSVVLQPGMRAMSIPVSDETGAGGFVQPGDRVDVLEAHTDQARKGAYISDTVVSNVRVLAVDQSTGPAKNGKSTVAKSLTLEVPADSAPDLAVARSRGGVSIALRSYADMAGGAGGQTAPAAGHGIRLIKGGVDSQTVVSQ
jgi:pilus assembly protein CpaB